MGNGVLRHVILGTGNMAGLHAEAFAEIDGVELVAAVDTDPGRLRAFCDTHKIANRFETLEAALEWGDFDSVSNITPDRAHYPTTMPLLSAGKHVLCEKPLADNYPHAVEMARVAADTGVVNMVNLTYRGLSSMQEARRLIAAGAIGTVRHFEASYLQSWLTQPLWGDWRTDSTWLWRLSTSHGSAGVLGDIGIHILDYATYVIGDDAGAVSSRLKTFAKAPGDRIGDYVLDANDSFTMQLELDAGAIGVVHATRFASGNINDLRLRVWGDEGGLEVALEGKTERLLLCAAADLQQPVWRETAFPPTESNYRRFAQAVRGGVPVDPDFARAAALQEILDLAARSDRENGLMLRRGSGATP